MALGMEMGLRPGHIVLDGDPAPQKGNRAPILRPIVIMAKQLDASRCHLVWRWASAKATLCWMGTQPSLSRKRGHSPFPIFGPFLLWPNSWMHQDATWYGNNLSPGDFVLDVDSAPSPKKGGAPHFSTHDYCGKTAAWIKMPLGTEIGLGPYVIVLDWDQGSKIRVR